MIRTYFVSSSFRDIHDERDWLQRELLPAFRERCQSHGDEAEVVDLRIGIDTFDLEDGAATRKILDVCTSELEHSRTGGMIIFLGDRYGTIPKPQFFTKEIAEQFTATENKSVTALEIDYGLFKEPPINCIICLRTLRGRISADDCEQFFEIDPVAKRELKNLKRRLKQKFKGNLIEYTADWDGKRLANFQTANGDLLSVLLERMTQNCRADWAAFKNLSWQERELQAAHQLLQERAESFVERGDKIAWLKNLLACGGKIFLRGDKGCGKSTLISKVVSELKGEVCCIFAGLSTNSADALFVLKQMVYFAEKVSGEKHLSFDDDENPYSAYLLRLNDLCKKISRPIFVIDGVDQLADDEHRKFLDFLPRADNVKCLVSGADFDFSSAQTFFGVKEVHTLEFLADGEVTEVLRKILERNHKDLFAQTAHKVQTKNGKNSPLWLDLAAQAINMISAQDFRTLSRAADVVALTVKFIDKMPDDPKEATVHVLDEAAERLCTKNKQSVLDALYLLASAPAGLRLSDLQKIFAAEGKVFPELDFALLRKYLHTFFFERSTGIDFKHALIRDGILSSRDEKTFAAAQKKLAEHVRTLPKNDLLRNSEGARSAVILNDKKFFAQLLGEAAASKNALLLYGLKQSFLADDAAFFVDVLKSVDTLPRELIENLSKFNAQNIISLFRGSAKEFEIAKKIHAALPILDKDMTYFSRELMLAHDDGVLGNSEMSMMRCTKITHWGEKNFAFADNILFCQLISNAYDCLTNAQLMLGDYSQAYYAAARRVHWAKRVLKAKRYGFENVNVPWINDILNKKWHRLSGKFSLAQAFAMKAFCLRLNGAPLDKIIDCHKRAHEIYIALLPEKENYVGSFFQDLRSAFLKVFSFNSTLLAQALLEENIDEALALAREVEKYTEQFLAIGTGDADTILFAGGVYRVLASIEIKLEHFDAALTHANKSLEFYRNVARLNPGYFGEEYLSTAIVSLKTEFGDAGRGRADLAEQIS